MKYPLSGVFATTRKLEVNRAESNDLVTSAYLDKPSHFTEHEAGTAIVHCERSGIKLAYFVCPLIFHVSPCDVPARPPPALGPGVGGRAPPRQK
ncbi:hypothetical protein EVAR_10447_1 [Eumeta japonica]|uniref:Uncharacterized protein n=1 Tax=Eumeta variegata TaxID=151549 RepID=A0A4C1TH82_EUMVA|nr:hypothetical protein EVAR_10447_1 [Eumeta japonica]